MNKKEKILQMYFEEHQNQNIISGNVGVKQSYISQVIKKDDRYLKEKQEKNKQLCGNSYNQNYLEYICVNDGGKVITNVFSTKKKYLLLKNYFN